MFISTQIPFHSFLWSFDGKIKSNVVFSFLQIKSLCVSVLDSNVLVQRNTLEAILFFFPFYTALVRGLLWDGSMVGVAQLSPLFLPNWLNFEPSKSTNFRVSCAPAMWGVEETLLLLYSSQGWRNDFRFRGYLGCAGSIPKKSGVYSSRILKFRIVHMKLFLWHPRGGKSYLKQKLFPLFPHLQSLGWREDF